MHKLDNETTELEKAQAKASEYLQGWKRAQADLENFRKDEARRVQDVLRFGNERMLLEMLDILDGLETTLQHAPPDTEQKWLEGMEQAISKFHNTLQKHDIEKIKAAGELFDPLLHEAVQVEDSDSDEQKVLEELRPGYTLHNKVIRPARVKVSK